MILHSHWCLYKTPAYYWSYYNLLHDSCHMRYLRSSPISYPYRCKDDHSLMRLILYIRWPNRYSAYRCDQLYYCIWSLLHNSPCSILHVALPAIDWYSCRQTLYMAGETNTIVLLRRSWCLHHFLQNFLMQQPLHETMQCSIIAGGLFQISLLALTKQFYHLV